MLSSTVGVVNPSSESPFLKHKLRFLIQTLPEQDKLTVFPITFRLKVKSQCK